MNYRWHSNERSMLLSRIAKRYPGRQFDSDSLEEVLTDISRSRAPLITNETARCAIHYASDGQWLKLIRDVNKECEQ